MSLFIILTALATISHGAKLDRTYVPAAIARSAGAVPQDLRTPGANPLGPPEATFEAFEAVAVESAEGVASGRVQSGLGGAPEEYGSLHSKVGEAAFRGAQNQQQQSNKFITPGPVCHHCANSDAQSNSHQQSSQQVSSLSSIPYTDPAIQSSGIPGSVIQTEQKAVPNSFNQQVPERVQAIRDRIAQVVQQEGEASAEGYRYSFETENGISAEEAGNANDGVHAQGSFSYTGDDGQNYSIVYTADENGYHPKGAHLPTPPPIPTEILKSIEQNLKDEVAGIMDDGTYDDVGQYSNGGDQSGHFHQYVEPVPRYEGSGHREPTTKSSSSSSSSATNEFIPYQFHLTDSVELHSGPNHNSSSISEKPSSESMSKNSIPSNPTESGKLINLNVFSTESTEKTSFNPYDNAIKNDDTVYFPYIGSNFQNTTDLQIEDIHRQVSIQGSSLDTSTHYAFVSNTTISPYPPQETVSSQFTDASSISSSQFYSSANPSSTSETSELVNSSNSALSSIQTSDFSSQSDFNRFNTASAHTELTQNSSSEASTIQSNPTQAKSDDNNRSSNYIKPSDVEITDLNTVPQISNTYQNNGYHYDKPSSVFVSPNQYEHNPLLPLPSSDQKTLLNHQTQSQINQAPNVPASSSTSANLEIKEVNGTKEEFGDQRQPASFDEITGYHY